MKMGMSQQVNTKVSNGLYISKDLNVLKGCKILYNVPKARKDELLLWNHSYLNTIGNVIVYRCTKVIKCLITI
jgi:hypothetical protein